MAPEVLKKSYDEKCDIWSCGVVMYILLCGYPPFRGKTLDELNANILKGKVQFNTPEWHDVSKKAKDLIK
jgi:calcium-dependent protein kinase